MKIKIEIDVTEEVHDFENAIKAWDCGKEDEKELKEAYAKDRKALHKVLNLFKKGKIKESYKAAWDLDTIVRDQIPGRVWKLYNYAATLS